MAAEKSGMWFLELILNVLLLGGVAYVTFSARGEQERGLAVPLFAAVSPATTRTAVEPRTDAKPPLPNLAPAVNQAVGKATDATNQAVNAVKNQGAMTFEQSWGALQIWAAGLDGKITPVELKSIQDSLGATWNGTQSVRDYLKSVNDRINAGGAEQVVRDALQTLGQQAGEKKTQVLQSVVGFLKSNGVTWEQTQQLVGQWVGSALRMSPMDLWNSLKF